MKRNRHSAQRDEIMKYLCSTKEHPTAEQIYAQVRKTIPNISLGTVYRNLALLEDLGKVRRVAAGHNAEHFDANMSEHHHFVCSRCGAILDVELKALHVEDLAEPDIAECITGYDIVFRGLCRNCRCEEEKTQDKEAAAF